MTSVLTPTRAARPSADEGLAARLGNISWPAKAAIFAGEVVLFLVLWQLAVDQWEMVNPTFFPPPLDIAEGFRELWSSGVLTDNAVVSIKAWLTGYALAVVIGVPLGLLMGSLLPVDRILGPIAWTLYATPVLAYQPLSKAWFGFGSGPVIFLIVMSAIFPILINVSAGIRTTDRSLLHAGQVYGAGRIALYRKVFLPSTVVFLFAGLRQAAVMATIGMVAAELTGAAEGMGALIMRSSNLYQTDQSFAAIGLVVLWSVGISQLIAIIGRQVAPWARTSGR
jgi:ABC-type nitrate/sulfonate/bicarbonate transport system permease component